MCLFSYLRRCSSVSGHFNDFELKDVDIFSHSGGSVALLGDANISTVPCVLRGQWQLQLRFIDMSVTSNIDENDLACLNTAKPANTNSDNDKLPQNMELCTGMRIKPNEE